MRARLIVAATGLALTVGGFCWAASGLPAFGKARHRYGAIVARRSLPERSATNSVAVTTFDYRAIDTLGEEFILFSAVIGVIVLLRRIREESARPERGTPRSNWIGSDSSRALGTALIGPLLMLGAYVITHGQLTPGGGFQGGVVLFTAIVFLFLAGQYALLIRLRRESAWLELAESAGALGFAIIGFGGLVAGAAFFYNFLPKGTSGLLTGGTIPLANIAVGIEVAGALLLVVCELFEARLLPQRR